MDFCGLWLPQRHKGRAALEVPQLKSSFLVQSKLPEDLQKERRREGPFPHFVHSLAFAESTSQKIKFDLRIPFGSRQIHI